MSKIVRVTIRITLQVILLIGFALIGQIIAKVANLPVPGSLIGLGLLFVLLQLKLVKIVWFEQGANFLLAEMLLFFVPSATGIVQYGTLVRADGWQVIVTIAVSTLLVMTVSGMLLEQWSKRRKKVKTQEWQYSDSF